MAQPEIVKRNVTCPNCNSAAEVEGICLPHECACANGDNCGTGNCGTGNCGGCCAGKSRTWVDCPSCRHEWELTAVPPVAQEQVS